MYRFVKAVKNFINCKDDANEDHPCEAEERKLEWILNAENDYNRMTAEAKIEHLKEYLSLLRHKNPLWLFEKGRLYTDAFAKLFIIIIDSKGLPFSGYKNALCESKNPILEYYISTIFREIEQNELIENLICCLERSVEKTKENQEELLFIKRSIISVFSDGDLAYAYHVENPGFFPITGKPRVQERPVLPEDNRFDPTRILIGTKNGEKAYHAFEKPMTLLVCDQQRRDSVLSDIIIDSLRPPFKKLKLIIFDSFCTFEQYKDRLPSLYWPVISGRRIDYMIEELLHLVNQRSAGKRDITEEIMVLFDDMTRLNSSKLLEKILSRSSKAHVHFVYPLYEDRIPLSCVLDHAEFVDLSDTQRFFSTEAIENMLSVFSNTDAEFDSAYFRAEKFITWSEEVGHEKASLELDPLFKAALKYALDFNVVSESVLQKRLGIGYTRAKELVKEMENLGVLGRETDKFGNRKVLATMSDEEIDYAMDIIEKELS